VDHYWVEDVLNATKVTLTASYAAGDASITVASTAGIAVGALLMNESVGKEEVMQVTAVTNSTTLAVSRGVGDSAAAAEASAGSTDTLRVIGQPKQEGDSNVNDVSVVRKRKSNTCQIFKKEVQISGTQMAVHMAGVPDEYNYQLAHRTLELRRELGMAVYAGVQITAGGAGGSDSVIRSMDGLYNRVRRSDVGGGATQLDTTSVAFSEDVINGLYQLIYAQGGEANFVVGTQQQMRKFSSLYKDKIRLSPSDRQRGVFVTKFLTDMGVEVDLIIDRWAKDGAVTMGDERRLRLVPLKGRAWQAVPLAKQGDDFRGMIVGEYTLEIRNAAQCFAQASKLNA